MCDRKVPKVESILIVLKRYSNNSKPGSRAQIRCVTLQVESITITGLEDVEIPPPPGMCIILGTWVQHAHNDHTHVVMPVLAGDPGAS